LGDFPKTHWYQNWYQSGFSQEFAENDNLHNSLELQRIKLEAGVRIGHFPPRLQGNYARFYWLLKRNPSLPSRTDSNSFGVRFGVHQ
jgi:hypothetical protein